MEVFEPSRYAFQVRRSYGLPVRDREGRHWDFVVKSWANGTEHRRVYVLEHVAEFISARRLREGDAIGLCADAQGALVVEVTRMTRIAVVPQAPCATCESRHGSSQPHGQRETGIAIGMCGNTQHTQAITMCCTS